MGQHRGKCLFVSHHEPLHRPPHSRSSAGGNQSSNECTYTGYARVAVIRTSSGWTTSTAESISPQAAITFPPGTGGSGTAAFFSIGTASSGTGEILYSGPISPNIVTGNGVTPQLTTGTTVTES